MAHPKLYEVLSALNGADFIAETEISAHIENVFRNEKDYEKDQEDLAEIFAFNLMPHQSTGSEKYYRPMLVWENGVCFPDPSRIDETMVNHWKKRYEESDSDVMVLRYADLVVEFSQKPEKNFAEAVLVRTLAIIKNTRLDKLHGLQRLVRALNITKRFRDGLDVKFGEIGKELAKYEEDSPDELPGLWGLAMEEMVINRGNYTIPIGLEESILDSVKTRLVKMSTTPDAANGAERAFELLSTHYKKTRDYSALIESLALLEKAFRRDAHSNSSHMNRRHYLKKLLKYFTENKNADDGFGMNRIGLEFRQECMSSLSELSSVSVKTEIPMDSINSQIASVIKEGEGLDSLSESLCRMVYRFSRDPEKAKECASKSYKGNALISIIPQELLGNEGLPIAELGPFENNEDRHAKSFATRTMALDSWLLAECLRKLIAKFGTDVIGKITPVGGLFGTTELKLVEKAFSSFYRGDFFTASAILIPVTEEVLRRFATASGVHVLRERTAGCYEFISMDVLLGKSEMFTSSFGNTHSSAIQFTFQLILTDGLGMALRNTFCHGSNNELFETEAPASWLMFVIITLAVS